MTTKPKTDKLYRVYRGGSWSDTTATDVRAAYRDDYTPLLRNYDIGFRCSQRGCRQVLEEKP